MDLSPTVAVSRLDRVRETAPTGSPEFISFLCKSVRALSCIHVLLGNLWFFILMPSAGISQMFENLNLHFPMSPSEYIFQDSKGFLWIGTMNGLVRFDGYATVMYTHDPNDSASLAGNNINFIGEDGDGRIWVGTRAFGLDILDANHRKFQHICFPLPGGGCRGDMHINAGALDPDSNQMWIGSRQGIFIFTPVQTPQIIRTYTANPDDPYSLSGDLILHIFIDSKHRIWVGTREGINLYDRLHNRFVNHKTNSTFSDLPVLDIGENPAGQVWVSLRYKEQRLIVFDEESGDFICPPEFISYAKGEFKFTFGPENDLWICSRGVGAFHYDETLRELRFFDPQYSALHGYKNLYGLQTVTDRYGNIWMTGTYVLKRPSTGKDLAYFSAPDAPVVSVFTYRDHIWFSDLEPKRFDLHTGEITAYWPPELPHNIRSAELGNTNSRRIYGIREYEKDKLVMVSTRNVFLWNATDDTFQEIPVDAGGPFRDFLIADDREHLWICGNQGLPLYFSLSTGTVERLPAVAEIQNPRCVDRGPDGDIWFGTSTHGVYRFDPRDGTIINFSPTSTLPEQKLSDYYVHDMDVANDVVWVATNLGANRIDIATNTVTYVRKQEFFPDENVLSIVVDNSGKVWMGTQKGLVRYDPVHHALTHLDEHDGLINRVYTEGACFKDSLGQLYFGGDRGVDYFDPEKIGINTIPPDIYINKIRVNNEPADTGLVAFHIRELSLPHTENSIEIELLAIHLTAPLANQYAYQIPEIDEGWRDLGTNRTISLVNMRPGNYTLRARASNADGIWSREKELLHLEIRPPFWETWWFLGLCGFCIALSIGIAYRYRVRQIEKREQLKSEFNKRIAEMESKALRAQMNPHFLFNSINSVKSLISQGENEKATQYLTRFGQLLRQVLANSEKQFVRLQEELEALRLYLDIEQLRFQNFEYTLNIGENVDTDFIEVPPLILQPYVENAIWHGLMHKTSGERKVCIDVRRNGEFLHMSVEDNGIGRTRAGQLKMLGGARKGGMGMRLTGDRLKLLEKLYGQDVRVRVLDLHQNGTATGTCVEIQIPYSE